MKGAMIFGIPLVALGVAGWAAWQVHRHQPGPSASIVMMLPGEVPPLNPFLPASEAGRQILDLIHEPLIRLDGEGRLAPALAKSWAWHQRVSCWFSSEEALQAAQRQLAAVSPATRQAWELEEVTTEGLSLVLLFASPRAAGADAALQALASEALLPLTFLRLESQPAARTALEEYARSAVHEPGTLRLWFDEDGTCELVTLRPWLQVRESLASWLRQKGQPVPRITPLAEVAGLLEPVLDFDLDPAGPAWPDGSPVTVADIQATVAHVMRLGYPVPGREGFRHIQAITPLGSSKVRITYRRSYGAALAGWAGLPILQESWLKNHPQGTGEALEGLGKWQAARIRRELALIPRRAQEGASVPSLHIIPATSALQARVAIATGSLDVIWPGDGSGLSQEPALAYHSAPPRNRLLILWNLRSSCLSELPVREALALGLDRQSLLTEGLGLPARLADPLFPPGIWYAPESLPPVFDSAGALQKLESAGWLRDVTGVAKKGGQPLEFQLLVTVENRQRARLADLIARQWAQYGARVSVTAVAPEDLVAAHLAPGKFDAVILGLDYELTWDHMPLWHSGQIGSGMNYSRVADSQLDQLLEAMASEFDVGQLPARAKALQQRFLALQPALPLIGDLRQIGVRKARFPDLGAPDLGRPVTLRSLLRSLSPPSLEMRTPNEQ